MAGWVAGAVAVSGYLGAQSARKSGQEQAGAANRATDVSNEQYYQTREDQAPYRAAGVNALGELQRTAGDAPPSFKFTNQDMYADPGYGFRFSEGQKALDRSAAARGGLISGGALKAATRFGQEMGSQEYQNAYNRAYTGYGADVARNNQLYNRQAALAGIGQTATGLTNQAGATNAANVGNLMTSGAAANAAGRVGQTNAITGGLGTYLNYNQANNLTQALQNNTLQNQFGVANVYGKGLSGVVPNSVNWLAPE
jgi:hypothetical protein